MYCLLVALLFGSNIIFGMEKSNLLTEEKLATFKAIVAEKRPFRCAAPKIRALMNTCPEKECLSVHDGEWCSILESKKYVRKLLDYVPEQRERVAALLGTPGAITWGKEYIAKNSQAKRNLELLLCEAVRWQKEHFVCPDEDRDVIKAMLDMGTNVNAVDNDEFYYDDPGCPPIILAAARNKIKVVTLLLDRGADIETRDKWDKKNPLLVAAFHGHNEIVDLLLQRKAKVNVDCFGETALMFAARNKHVETVKKLVAAGININIVNKDGRTALEMVTTDKRFLLTLRENYTEKSFTQAKEDYKTIIKLLRDAQVAKLVHEKNCSSTV